MDFKIQKILWKYSEINRKYQLQSKEELFSNFSNVSNENLENAWKVGLEKIQNREIIKNTSQLPSSGEFEIKQRLKEFNYNSQDLYYYLNSSFNVKELKLDEERIERRLRHILAQRHQKLLKNEIKNVRKKDRLDKIKDRICGLILQIVIVSSLVGYFFGEKIINGLTPVDVLTERLYNESVYTYNGSMCRDGTTSYSQGRGTCSWHGGVSYEFFKGEHKKTKNECRIEAKKISWID